MALFLTDMLALAYMALRSGAAGLAFLIDTHISAVIGAIVLSHAPKPLCRKAVSLLVIAAFANGVAGIAEASGKFRIFTFDPDWPVLHEAYFRASAFIGHPLDNAIFTVVALFVLLVTDYPLILKALVAAILLAALAAFGGRAALACSVFGLLMLACASLWKIPVHQRITLPQLCMVAGAGLAMPLFMAAIAWLAVHGGMGERLAASATGWDGSADARRLALSAFDYMKPEEIWFGVPGSRIMDIVYRMNLKVPLAEIENPWILMCMSLGAIVFPFWLMATLAFIYRLMKKQPLALRFAVLSYFLIASTANSFGRKDANYLIMASAAICAGRMGGKTQPKPEAMDITG
jgi:hypothetical protein